LNGGKGSVYNRYKNPKILQDYLADLKHEKLEEYTRQGPEVTKLRAKAWEKYQEAIKDWVQMVDGVGQYEVYPPKEDSCEANLFKERQMSSKETATRLMHWNILADGLAGSGLALNNYAKSIEKQFAGPKEALVWEYRMWLILEEIAHYQPDLITLVELDGNQDLYNKDTEKKTKLEKMKPRNETLIHWLEQIGYDMEYKAKGSGYAEMGTGFFWRKDKFQPIASGGSALISTSFSKDTGGQIFSLMLFEGRSGNVNNKLAVCALHLQSDKDQEGEDKRWQQIQEALYALSFKPIDYIDEGFKPPIEPNILKEYAVIITGDFNAERTVSLGTSGLITPKVIQAVTKAGFFSLYKKDLPWTSWKKRPEGSTDKYTIDYVFGLKQTTGYHFFVKTVAVLEGVPDDQVDERILLPNWNSGSDHISLVVDFQIKKRDFQRLAYEDGKLMIGDYNFRIESVAGTIIAVLVFTFIGWKYLTPPKPRTEKSVPTTVE